MKSTSLINRRLTPFCELSKTCAKRGGKTSRFLPNTYSPIGKHAALVLFALAAIAVLVAIAAFAALWSIRPGDGYASHWQECVR